MFRAMLIRVAALLGGAVLWFASFGMGFFDGTGGFLAAVLLGSLSMLVVSNVVADSHFIIAKYASIPAAAVAFMFWINADMKISMENGVGTMIGLALTCAIALHIGAWAGPRLK